jgi:acyl carrier protein
VLRDLVADVLQMPVDELPEDANADDLEAWDSLKHLDIVLALEEKTGVKFQTDEIPQLTSLARLEAALTAHGWTPGDGA